MYLSPVDGLWHVSKTDDLNQLPDGVFYRTDDPYPDKKYAPGGPNVDEETQNSLIAMEARQNKLLTDFIKALRTGQWTGPGSVDGIYCALRGGIAAPDYTPTFP